MTQSSNRVLDEFAKLMTDAAGVAQGVRREVETAFRGQAERLLGEFNVVQREEFEIVRDMAAKARDENEALRRRIEILETRLVLDPFESAGSGAAQEPAKLGAASDLGPATGTGGTAGL